MLIVVPPVGYARAVVFRAVGSKVQSMFNSNVAQVYAVFRHLFEMTLAFEL